MAIKAAHTPAPRLSAAKELPTANPRPQPLISRSVTGGLVLEGGLVPDVGVATKEGEGVTGTSVAGVRRSLGAAVGVVVNT